MDNLFKYLKDMKIEKDWKAMLFIVSLFIFLYSLFSPIQGIDNNTVQLLSLGIMFLSLGAILSFKDDFTRSPEYGILCTIKKFTPSFKGIFFILLGSVLLVAGILKLLF